jgi:hypothetical protein
MAFLTFAALGKGVRGWFAAALLAALATPAPAQFNEREIKAAFLVKFTQFVEWSGREGSKVGAPIVIAVLNSPRMASEIARIAAKEDRSGATVVAKSVSRMEDAGDCHVLFVPSEETARFRSAASDIRRKPILVVGESPGFALTSGHINFYLDGSHVRFEVNVEAARGAGLQISSRLLSLARVVRPQGR